MPIRDLRQGGRCRDRHRRAVRQVPTKPGQRGSPPPPARAPRQSRARRIDRHRQAAERGRDLRELGGERAEDLALGARIREERLLRVTLNEPVSHEKFTIPAIVRAQDEAGRRIVTGWTQRRRAAGLPYEEYTRVQHVDMAPLAPGVWLARGGTHNSFVIEMVDHLVVFEPPLFEARSEGVI